MQQRVALPCDFPSRKKTGVDQRTHAQSRLDPVPHHVTQETRPRSLPAREEHAEISSDLAMALLIENVTAHSRFLQIADVKVLFGDPVAEVLFLSVGQLPHCVDHN